MNWLLFYTNVESCSLLHPPVLLDFWNDVTNVGSGPLLHLFVSSLSDNTAPQRLLHPRNHQFRIKSFSPLLSFQYQLRVPPYSTSLLFLFVSCDIPKKRARIILLDGPLVSLSKLGVQQSRSHRIYDSVLSLHTLDETLLKSPSRPYLCLDGRGVELHHGCICSAHCGSDVRVIHAGRLGYDRDEHLDDPDDRDVPSCSKQDLEQNLEHNSLEQTYLVDNKIHLSIHFSDELLDVSP